MIAIFFPARSSGVVKATPLRVKTVGYGTGGIMGFDHLGQQFFGVLYSFV
jgi:hypothetical protein